jgi:hypothetical protein
MTNVGEVRVGQAAERVDAMEKSSSLVMGLDPSAVSVADLVVEPDEGAPAGPLGEETRFQCSPRVGISSSSGNSTTGNCGRPSRGATASFASAIHVVAQTSSHPNPSSLRPSSGLRRSSSGFPGSVAKATVSLKASRSGRARNGMSGPSTSRNRRGRTSGLAITPVNLSQRQTSPHRSQALSAANECADEGLPRALSLWAAGPANRRGGRRVREPRQATEQDSTCGRIVGDQFLGEPS